jgi:hypothetical protein
MRHGYTHITLLCDRSGSMGVIRADAEGGVRQFVADQKAVPGEATLLLVDFDAPHGGGVEWLNVIHDGDVRSCPDYTLTPRGSTALLDAIGSILTRTGEKLAAMSEDERPEHVIFVVQTDGQENSSKEWTLERVQEAIKRQTDEFSWHFVFLGMGPDTFAQGVQMGFQNVTKSADAGAAYVATYDNTSRAVGALRTNSVSSLAATQADVDEHGNVTPA